MDDILQIKRNLKTQYSFIPTRLKIINRPELSNFPFKVMFSSSQMEGEKVKTGYAYYVPIIDTFEDDGVNQKMKYRNMYGGDGWLKIIYHREDDSYAGEKYVSGKLVGVEGNKNWKWFFVHFTALGLSSGEACEFEVTE